MIEKIEEHKKKMLKNYDFLNKQADKEVEAL